MEDEGRYEISTLYLNKNIPTLMKLDFYTLHLNKCIPFSSIRDRLALRCYWLSDSASNFN